MTNDCIFGLAMMWIVSGVPAAIGAAYYAGLWSEGRTGRPATDAQVVLVWVACFVLAPLTVLGWAAVGAALLARGAFAGIGQWAEAVRTPSPEQPDAFLEAARREVDEITSDANLHDERT